MAPATRGVPVGEPPDPNGASTLDELTDRLQDLRSWARLTLRDLPERVETLRRKRGIRERREVRPSYGAVHALFQPARKRLDEGLLLDTVRVLLNCQAPSAAWREERVADWRKTYRMIIKQQIYEVRSPEFRLGPLQTPCRILEGADERVIEEQHVRVQLNPTSVHLPHELAEWRAEIAAEQARRRRAGENYVWNGPRYAVEDLIISRVGPREAPEVTLRLKYSDYYTFFATQYLDRQFRSGGTPRSLYIDGRDPRDVPDFMRSSFGVNIALVTADGWLVVSRRSHHVGVGKSSWNSSANEGLHRHLDSNGGGPPNLFRVAERGVKEELHIEADQYRLRLLAFAVVTSLSQWCALFLALLDKMSRRDFENHVSRGIPDGWEHPEFDYVRFDPEHVLRYLLREDRRRTWAPAAPVLFYLSLVNACGRLEVDDVAERVLRDLL